MTTEQMSLDPEPGLECVAEIDDDGSVCGRRARLHLVETEGWPTDGGTYRGDSWCSHEHMARDIQHAATRGGAAQPRDETSPEPQHPQVPVDRNTAPVGHQHPDTSRAAAARALPRTGTRRRAAYDWIASRAGHGATADEVGEHYGWPHQSYSPIVSTLARDGWLRTEEHRQRGTRSGALAAVYVAVPEEER